MTNLLEVDDVVVRFPMAGGFLSSMGLTRAKYIEAVAGVSLTVAAGETFAVVGESGSGKTTLIRAIAGLQAAKGGSIRYKGQELGGIPEAQFRPLRRDITMMFQDPVGSLSPRKTVKALITEPYIIQGMKDHDLDVEAKRLLQMVNLPAEFATRYPYQLSGGQARRVGVARALALDPKLILADEPTAGLDVSVQGELLNLLGRLQSELGIAMLIITHNLNVVRHVADRVGIMYLGRFVEEGPTEAVFDSPRHPYTLALLAANPEPDPDAVLSRIELLGEPPSLLSRPAGCEFHPRCPFVRERCSSEIPQSQLADDNRVHSCHWTEVWKEA